MQVASLAVVQGVSAARRRSVVAGRLIGKRGECEAVGVEERGGEAPWLVVPTRCGIRIFDIFLVAIIAGTQCLLAEGSFAMEAVVPVGNTRLGQEGARRARHDDGELAGAPGREHTEPCERHQAHRRARCPGHY